MIQVWLILSVLIGGLLAWAAGLYSNKWPRWVSILFLLGHMTALIYLWADELGRTGVSGVHPWLREFDVGWIPQIGARLHLGMDGFSLLLIVLANFLGIMAIAASWNDIQYRVGFFHFNMLWIISALTGLFLSLDLLLFYFFWEVLMVPLFLLIAIWGYGNRRYAALKFFLFTQAGSLLMLASILGVYFFHGGETGVYTFDFLKLMDTPIPYYTSFALMLGFLVACGVKLPAVPLHTWLPDAHTEAPTAGSVDLAGLVLKIGAYALLRFIIPLFPETAFHFAPVAMVMGVIGIIYGAVVALGQTDLKRLIAYTSISHMGFVLIGIFAWDQLALQGAVIIMIAHGISTGALFILTGDLQYRLKTRELSRMGGFWSSMPRMGGAAMFFALASLGLPGMANFVGEFLVLVGTFRVNVPIAVIATCGMVVSVIYSVWMMQRVFFGPPRPADRSLRDMTPRETVIMACMIGAIVWIGFFPQTVLRTSAPAMAAQRDHANRYSPLAREKPAPVTRLPSAGGDAPPGAAGNAGPEAARPNAATAGDAPAR